jgi:hypothetical protein
VWHAATINSKPIAGFGFMQICADFQPDSGFFRRVAQ